MPPEPLNPFSQCNSAYTKKFADSVEPYSVVQPMSRNDCPIDKQPVIHERGRPDFSVPAGMADQ